MAEQVASVIQLPGRPRLGRWADRFRWLIDHSLGPLYAAMRFTPNGVTLTGMVICVGFAVAWTQYPHHPWLFWTCLAGFVFGALHDTIDGSVARLEPGRKKPSGSEVDNTSDRIVELFMYIAIGLVLGLQGHPYYCAVAFSAGAAAFMVTHQRARAETHGLVGEVGWAPREVRLPLLGILIIAGHYWHGFGWGMVMMNIWVWPMAAWRFINTTTRLDRGEGKKLGES